MGRGGAGRGLLRNCEEHIDNIITPLMHHRNTANVDDRNEGMCDWVEVGVGRGGGGGGEGGRCGDFMFLGLTCNSL